MWWVYMGTPILSLPFSCHASYQGVLTAFSVAATYCHCLTAKAMRSSKLLGDCMQQHAPFYCAVSTCSFDLQTHLPTATTDFVFRVGLHIFLHCWLLPSLSNTDFSAPRGPYLR
ncbi:hypothetical protein B0T25DRAFT_289137 [Lasiosphaeria hispida]|uniref:Secreted protein n=1 Tax=Lasiosphaeria hispida TaxID=260671 RepID=A0AAJ0HC16_9PEZI|nr:hypothetical protein B0T25DRAFT_289137 [Lasiosphaeria hispida]